MLQTGQMWSVFGPASPRSYTELWRKAGSLPALKVVFILKFVKAHP